MTLPIRQNRSLLVLGASGKLGLLLRKHWQGTPPEGLTVGWQYRENPPKGGLLWHPGMPPQAALPRVDAILALWGVTPAPGRDLAENRRLAVAAMELAEALGARRVLHCSSAAVYSPGPAPLRETQAGGEINAYGASKLEMEQALSNWTRAHLNGPRSCALRIANVVGADSLFAAMARGGVPITLDRFETGEGPWRSYVPVAALARVVAALLACPEDLLPPVINVASPVPVAMEALARAAGCDIVWRDAPDGAAPMVALDTTALSQIVALPGETPDQIIAAWRRLGERP